MRLEDAIESYRIREARRTAGLHYSEFECLENTVRREPTVHPPANTQGLGREKHVLADNGRLGEHVIASLTLQRREWQELLCIEKTVLDPLAGPGGATVESVVDDV